MNWNELMDSIWERLPVSFEGVLATHDHESVTARTMSMIVYDGKIYFQTDINSEKYKQIKRKSNAAIAFNIYQFTGECKAIGQPLSVENKKIFELFQKEFPQAAKKYSGLEQEVLICFSPARIKIWKYENDGAVIETYNIENRENKKIKLGY